MITGRKHGYKEISSEQECQILFTDQEELCITGFKENILKKWIFYILNIPLCGTPLLLLDWYPQLIHLKYARSSLDIADFVMIKDSNDVYSIHTILAVTIPLEDTSETFQQSLSSFLKIKNNFKYFIYKDIKYIWLEKEMQFCQLRGWDGGVKHVKELLEESVGYTAEEQDILLKIYGKNEIRLSIPSPWKVLIKDIFQPFYLFQLFSIILWFVNDYVSYAICVVALTGFSFFVTLYTAKKEKKSLQNLVQKSSAGRVSVIRKNGIVEEIHPSLLVPGDIIQIPRNGCVMACDALLLNGNCIVNENVLTGESYPVTKTPPLSNTDVFNSIISKRHVLFCGTEVVQARYYGEGMVTAVTINTGFSTVKGEMIRCLLHPKPLGFKFYTDSIKFVFWLFFVATCGISYLCYVSYRRNIAIKTLVLDSLDLITIVVPPTLPAALTTGIAYSKSRLLSKGIFCISPPKINVFGKLKLMCFDKTGTLTEEGLDLWGVVPSSGKGFGKLIEKPSVLNPKHPLVVAMATCHTLTRIKGKLSGDPLDLSMFNSLNWELNEPVSDTSHYDLLCPTIVKPKNYWKPKSPELKDNVWLDGNILDENSKFEFLNDEKLECNTLPYEIGIVREFPFTSATRCMSVITRQLGAHHMNLYCKGAPERIGELCHPDSLPQNFDEELQMYASMGFRVLGVAYKQFDQKFTWRKSQRVKRQEVENGLTFLGLIIMQNKLKPASTGVMNDLRMANIRCVMITGDNLLTAISVSRECLMILPGDFIIEVQVTLGDGCGSGPSLSFRSVEALNPHDKFALQNQILFSKLSPPQIEIKAQSSRCHYALDGKTWELLRTHFSDLIPKIIVQGTVFARMLPEQKTQLVEAFQDLDYIVGMCGDGANDYGALKAAHVGVSLSDVESSVAAPFTSKSQDVSCIVSLVQEGRCALVSTFVIFKYMAIYSLIQFISVLIVYEKGVSFGNMEFLYVDLIVTSLLAVVIGRTGPSKKLVKERPIARLISFGNLFPLILQVLVILSTQLLALGFLYKQDWFIPVVPSSEPVTVSWENTVVYCTSLFQYMILALVYSKGKPYRQPFYKNLSFMSVFLGMTTFAVLLCVYPFRPVSKFFELIPVEEDSRPQTLFRIELLIFPILNLLLSFLIEISTGDRKFLKRAIHFVIRKKESKNRYKRILQNPDYHVY